MFSKSDTRGNPFHEASLAVAGMVLYAMEMD